MKELLVLSGKGGTGKTSITASLAFLFKNCIMADCDVDASNLHLLLSPNILETADFISGHEAKVIKENCTKCGECEKVCRFGAIHSDEDKNIKIDPFACEGCGVCVWTCPKGAIEFKESTCGQLYYSDTRLGPMVHAKLYPAAENSGKLVSRVRIKAKTHAIEDHKKIVLIDGPPGIGCPVISSITGVNFVLIVAEPSLSGVHDLKRVAKLAKHFGARIMVCINKYDINEQISLDIKRVMEERKIPVVGMIPYDKGFYKAQSEKKTIIEFDEGKAKMAIEQLYCEINKILKEEK